MDEVVTNKKYTYYTVGDDIFLRFNHMFQNNLKLSVGEIFYSFGRYNKEHSTYIPTNKAPYTGGYLSQKWSIHCKVINNAGKIQRFMNSTN